MSNTIKQYNKSNPYHIVAKMERNNIANSLIRIRSTYHNSKLYHTVKYFFKYKNVPFTIEFYKDEFQKRYRTVMLQNANTKKDENIANNLSVLTIKYLKLQLDNLL